MACDIPPLDWRATITARRIRVVGLGLAMLIVAIRLGFDMTNVAAFLWFAGAALLAGGGGIPLANDLLLGRSRDSLPIALRDRQLVLTELIMQRMLHRLTSVAFHMTLNDKQAEELVLLAAEKAAASWRGPVGLGMEKYLLCWVVQLAMKELLEPPPIDDGDPRAQLARLARNERAIWALHRIEVPIVDIAHIVGCSVEFVIVTISRVSEDQK